MINLLLQYGYIMSLSIRSYCDYLCSLYKIFSISSSLTHSLRNKKHSKIKLRPKVIQRNASPEIK